MKSIHISLTEFTHASRVLKEMSSLEKAGIFKKIIVISLGATGLDSTQFFHKNIIIRRLNLITRGLPKSFFFQIIKFFEFSLRTLLILIKEKPHAVNVHSVSLLPLGWLSKKIIGVKLVYDAHELETETIYLTGRRKKIFKWIEKKFIYDCDYVIVVGNEISSWYEHEYGITRPTVVLNAPSKKSLENSKININLKKQLGIASKSKLFIYQGGFAASRGIENMLETFSGYTIDKSIIFLGYGKLKGLIEEYASNNDNIFCLDAVSPDKLLAYTSGADYGISFVKPNCISHNYCLPNKLFEFLAAGCPVIVSNTKEQSKLVLKYGCGVVAKNNDKKALNEAIYHILSLDYQSLQNSASLAFEDVCWDKQEKTMIRGYIENGVVNDIDLP